MKLIAFISIKTSLLVLSRKKRPHPKQNSRSSLTNTCTWQCMHLVYAHDSVMYRVYGVGIYKLVHSVLWTRKIELRFIRGFYIIK